MMLLHLKNEDCYIFLLNIIKYFIYLLTFCCLFVKSTSNKFNNFITGFVCCFDIIILPFYLMLLHML